MFLSLVAIAQRKHRGCPVAKLPIRIDNWLSILIQNEKALSIVTTNSIASIVCHGEGVAPVRQTRTAGVHSVRQLVRPPCQNLVTGIVIDNVPFRLGGIVISFDGQEEIVGAHRINLPRTICYTITAGIFSFFSIKWH